MVDGLVRVGDVDASERTVKLAPSEKLILADLAFGPSTNRDLMAVTGLGRNQLIRLTNRLHAAGLIRVQSWERSHGGPRRVWALRKPGSPPDAPRPAPLSRWVVIERYRARHPEWFKRYRKAWWEKNAARVNERRRKRARQESMAGAAGVGTGGVE